MLRQPLPLEVIPLEEKIYYYYLLHVFLIFAILCRRKQFVFNLTILVVVKNKITI